MDSTVCACVLPVIAAVARPLPSASADLQAVTPAEVVAGVGGALRWASLAADNDTREQHVAALMGRL